MLVGDSLIEETKMDPMLLFHLVIDVSEQIIQP